MEKILSYISSHPLLVMVIALITLITIYLLLKNLLKLVLIVFLAVIAITGYFYLQDPQRMTESLTRTAQQVKTYTFHLWKAGQWAYKKSKDLTQGMANLIEKERKD